MQAFWDVLWADVTALAKFTLPMLLLALPTSALGALFGAVGFGLGSWGRLVRAIARGVLVACALVIVLGMLMEYGLRLEGYSLARCSLREYTLAPLWGAAIALAFGSGFFAARRYAPAPFGPGIARRRFTLLQLFAAQLVVGLLLGWWVFTRRDEIGSRRIELEWQSRDRAAKALFEPLGYEVSTWKEHDEMALVVWRSSAPVQDDSLVVVGTHNAVVYLRIECDSISDGGLAHLAHARRLRELQLSSTSITDVGVEALCELPRLRYLAVESPQLTGASLISLAKVKSLRFVSLKCKLITPAEQAAFRQARPDVDLRLTASGS